MTGPNAIAGLRGPNAMAVECAGVRKSFGSAAVALRGADLSLADASLAAVLGPSGCGKTTLLRVIAGFERIDSGTVSVSGRPVAGPGLHLPPERRRVTIVPQEHALFPHLDVAGNVGYGVRRGPERESRVAEMLEMAGLSGLGRRMPHELSGGQQQRVALARALAPNPSVVLFDEPFGSLDAALRAELRAEVAAVLRASGTTALLVTHDQEEALSMADTVAVMRDGAMVQHGPPDEIYRRPADLWVAGFVGSANILAGRVVAPGRVSCPLGVLAMLAGPDTGPVAVVVRPEQVVLTDNGAVSGLVEERRYFGHDALVRIRLGDGSHVLARVPSDGSAPAGATVSLACHEAVPAFRQGGPDGAAD